MAFELYKGKQTTSTVINNIVLVVSNSNVVLLAYVPQNTPFSATPLARGF